MAIRWSLDRARRVVVTGIGVISPAGRSTADLWQSLREGRSGIIRRAASALSEFPFGGAVKDFRIDTDCGPLDSEIAKAIRKSAKLMSRDAQMAVAAGQQALLESGLRGVDPERVGVCVGAENVAPLPEDFHAGVRACSEHGKVLDLSGWGDLGLPEIAPLWLLKCLPNMPACFLAMFNGFRGANNSITAGSVSANLALAEAYRQIDDGQADAVLIGATGTRLTPFGLIHARAEEEIAVAGDDPATVCRPFDRDRGGAVPAEGAAAFVLEDAEIACRRGTAIYGEVAGMATAYAANAGESGCRDAATEALRGCLDAAGWDVSSVGHLHAHGLSTRRMDADEAQAVREVFGPVADRLPIVAAKSALGDAGAGSGALELAASLLAMREGRLFPLLNYHRPDPSCPVRPVTSGDTPAGRRFLNLSLAPDGRASCVAIREWERN